MKESFYIRGLVLVGVLAAPWLGWSTDRLVPSQFATIAAAVSAAGAGDRIVISGQHVEDAQILVGVALTFTSGSPRADIRQTRFFVTAPGVTFRDLDLDGKSTGGARTGSRELITLTNAAGDALFEGCSIKHPGPGANQGNNDDAASLASPGACVAIRADGAVSFRNCTMVNDDDGPPVANEVCLHFGDATLPGPGPVLIEDCTFSADSRPISFIHGWKNVTVRRCTFDLNPVSSGTAASCVYFNLEDADAGGQMENVLIEGCTFNGENADGGSGVYCPSSKMVNTNIRNCYFSPEISEDAIDVTARGSNLVITDNQIDNPLGYIGMHLAARSFLGPNPLPKKSPALVMDGIIVSNNLVKNIPTLGIGIGENCLGNNVIENNIVTDMGAESITLSIPPVSSLIKNNQCIRGAGPAGLWLTGQNSTVAGNFFLDCANGIVIRTPRGDYGSAVDPYLDRHSHDLLFSRNIILRSGNNGIRDESADSGTDSQGAWTARSVNIRYVNNTIVNSASFNLAVKGDQISVYNNLFVSGAGSALNNGAVMDKFGFNLTYNSPYGGFAQPSTDIDSPTPPIVSLFPTSPAGVVLRPDSLAIDAGTGNGSDPDYTTDIGALESGAPALSCVTADQWRMYR